MNLVFHARIPVGTYFFLALLTAGCGVALWHKLPVHNLVLMLCMVFTIERIIHTTYTLTADRLIVSRGRFARRKNIPLTAIHRIEKCRVIRLGRSSLMSYLLVVYGNNEKYLPVVPVKEDEFLEKLTQRRRALSRNHLSADIGSTPNKEGLPTMQTRAGHRIDQP